MRRWMLGLGLVAAVGVPGFAAGSGQQQGLLPCESVQEPLAFNNYWVGPRFDGLALDQVIWECGKPFPDEGRLHGVWYIYANCPPEDAGCDYVDVQLFSSPAAERNKEMLDIVGQDTTIEGVPSSWYEGGWRLEMYFPDTTLVIHGPGQARIARFAHALQPGPRVLTGLAEHGVIFPAECRGSIRYCTARAPTAPGSTPLQTILNLLAVAIPAVMLGVLLLVVFRIRRDRRAGAPPIGPDARA